MSKASSSPALTYSLPELDELLGYALRRAQIQVFQHLVGQFAEYDLRPAQFSALALIHKNPGLTQVELARALAIEPPQLVLIVNKLEQRGLALRIRSKVDRRSYGLYLSKPGEALLEKLQQIAAASDEVATANLDKAERAQLLALLKKIYLGLYAGIPEISVSPAPVPPRAHPGR